jgi:hypothetical protein
MDERGVGVGLNSERRSYLVKREAHTLRIPLLANNEHMTRYEL